MIVPARAYMLGPDADRWQVSKSALFDPVYFLFIENVRPGEMMVDCGLTIGELTAAILIGGLGTRLRSVISDRPKVLAEILGRPLLAFLLDQLTAAGIKRVVLCAGYKGEQVQTVFGHSYGGLDLLYSQEASPLGTGGAIRFAIDLLRSDPILVMNGDSFCEVNLNAFYTWHCTKEANATLLLTQLGNTKRYGRVHVDADGLVFGFDEKGDKSGPGWINTGIYILNYSFLLTIPTNRTVSLEREMFPGWIGKGLYGYKCEGRFLDIGTPESYALAEQFFSSEMLI